MEDVIRRQMPNSIEAEKSVIGSMISDRDTIVECSEILLRDDFYHQQYGALFEAIVELYNAGEPVDEVTLQNKLREKGVGPEIASLEAIQDLILSVPTTVNAKNYANIVKDKALLRNIIKVNQNIENMCFEGTEDVDSILNQTEKDIFSLVQNRG